MTIQRILIKTGPKGSTAVVQVGNRSVHLVTLVTQREAWEWAKTVLDITHEQHAIQAANEAAEVAWNMVL